MSGLTVIEGLGVMPQSFLNHVFTTLEISPILTFEDTETILHAFYLITPELLQQSFHLPEPNI